MAPLPFDDSRRLTGPNLYFAGPGAVLETRVGAPVPTALIEDWKRRIARARAALGWPDGPVTVREHASGASLAFAAPGDMLYTAADVNEWAWLSALAAAGRGIGEPALQPGHPSFVDEDADLRLLRVVAAAEGLPAEAEQDFEKAIRLLSDVGDNYGLACAQLSLAELSGSELEGSRRQKLLGECLPIFERLGAQVELERARGLL